MKWLKRQDRVMLSASALLLYGLTNSLVREHCDEDSPLRIIALLAFSAVITPFWRQTRSKSSLRSFRHSECKNHLLLLLPLWILSTGNLWGGFRSGADLLHPVFVAISLFLIGYIEELLFRGLLLDALQDRYNNRAALILSSLLFGFGHILNLFSGPFSWTAVLQIPFAIGWGLLLSVLALVLENLTNCVLIHGMINVLSLFAVHNSTAETIYMASIVTAAIIYLLWFMKNSDRFISQAVSKNEQ